MTRSSSSATQPAPVAPANPWWNRWSPWLAACVFAAALISYWPALRANFIWDDEGHVTRASLRSLEGLFRIWFEPGATQQYYPVLHSAFWIEHHLWGDAAVGYHLLNVLLHATSACLLALLLRRLAVPGAWLAALLFAVHPVCVESVAWVSEQKNTLSTVLYLLSALAWLRFDESRDKRYYAWAFAAFALALLTKTVTATLPAALLVVTWWRRGRIDWRRDVTPLLPWFAFGLVTGLYTAHFERALIGAQGASFSLSVLDRCLLAGRVVWFYFAKFLWPFHLVFIYPRWNVDASEAGQYLFPLAAVAALGVLAWYARRSRAPLAIALLFGGSLFPALGFVNVYPFLFSYVADHFQYLASLAFVAAAAVLLHRVLSRIPVIAGVAISVALFGTLGALTWSQAGIYRDNETLFRATLAKNPACWMAHNNLGNLLAAAGRPEDAVAEFQQALTYRPDYAEAESNLGDQLNVLNRAEEAMAHLKHALAIQPRYPVAHNNLGVSYAALNRPQEAIAEFQEALKLDPGYAQAHYNLGLALATSGRYLEAIPHFSEAARLQPDYASAHLNLGVALSLADRLDESLAHLARAAELSPDIPVVHFHYGRILSRVGKSEEAVAQFRQAVELNPNFAEAHASLALELRRLGRSAEAAQEFQAARRLGAPIP